jgi:hypothetical protein
MDKELKKEHNKRYYQKRKLMKDKVKKQKDVIKKHQREYNLSILLNEKDSL